MNKGIISDEELNFLVRRNKEMELSQKITDELMNQVQWNLKKSLNSVEQYVKQKLDKHVKIELLKYHLINGRQSLATIFEDYLYFCQFNLVGYEGEHVLLASKTQFQHFNEHILNDLKQDEVIESLTRGLNVLYDSLGQQLNVKNQFKVENISVGSWSTQEDQDLVDLDVLYEVKRYAIEYGENILFIIHLSEVEFMEKIYDHLSDKMKERQIIKNDSELKVQSNVEVRKPLFSSFDDIKTPNANHNLGLLSDVPLEITVVLGKTKRSIQEILEINTGKIIELNKYADDPLEIYCNGKLIAEGEVVVVDDNFGIKVTKLHQVAMNKIK